MTMNRVQEWAARHGVSAVALAELASLYRPAFEAIPGGSEAFVQQTLRVTAAQVGGSLWRNNSGAAIDESGRHVRYGLANDSKKLNDVFKSSDLIGITPKRIEPRHVGETWGVFTAVECKAADWHGPPKTDRELAQSNFLRTVEAMGGIGLFATGAQEYRARVEK